MQFRVSMLLVVTACFASAATLEEARTELFAARYKKAAELYSKLLADNPAQPDAYYGLVRALLRDHRSHEAYDAAAEGLRKSPLNAGVQTAAGLAAYRRGDVVKAEEYFHAALQLDGNYTGALLGLASLNGLFSRFKTERGLLATAYRVSPGDPLLILAHANTLKGADHVAALEQALAILDPESEEGRNLKAHIANDIAAGDRKLRHLTSPYESGRIKLFLLLDGPSRTRGAGIRVQINRRQNLRLMLDTGATGISISPGSAERAGLEILGNQSADAKGFGDRPAQPSFRYLASEVRIGDVTFADYPISVFRSAKSADFDGLVGADVFREFLVTIDFPRMEVLLGVRPGGTGSGADAPSDAPTPPSGFHRAFRFGNHLAIPTAINGGKSTLFLIDSGSNGNVLDTEIGGLSTGIYREDEAVVKGIQGKVNKTSRADHVALVFAGFRQESRSLFAISLERTSDDMGVALGGILGWPVLSLLSVTIDYQDGVVHFEHRN